MAPRRSLAAVLLTTALLCACGSDGPAGADGVIDREVFIATYVDLRIAALETEDRRLTDEARAEVLSRHAVTEQALMDFAEANALDVEFMTSVWSEIESRLDAARPDDEAEPR